MLRIFTTLLISFCVFNAQAQTLNHKSILNEVITSHLWQKANLPQTIKTQRQIEEFVKKISNPQIKKNILADLKKSPPLATPISIKHVGETIIIQDIYINLKTQVISFHGKTYKYDYNSINYPEIKSFLGVSGHKTSFFDSIFINQAHADFGLSLLTVAVAIIVIDTVASVIQHASCESTFNETQKSVRELYETCLKDLEQADAGIKIETLDTHIFLDRIISFQANITNKSKTAYTCVDAVKEEHQNWSMFKFSTCVSDSDANELCRVLENSRQCISKFASFESTKSNNRSRTHIKDTVPDSERDFYNDAESPQQR